MLIDAALDEGLLGVGAAARATQQQGFHGLWIGETKHDPFLQLLRAADATDRVQVGSAIAVAFARSPMTLATSAYDLSEASEGRFVLGLGSQVKPHIERRFSMPWSRPADRMRELILALRAIWSSWEEGTKLDFRGEFFTHTLMTPYFAPPAHRWGPPPILLAAVGERMAEVAGEAADGLLLHPFTTERYLDEVTLPAITRGLDRSGRTLDDFTVAGPVFTCMGRDEAELSMAIAGTRSQIAFYASTPAYLPVLALHGWEDLQPELTRLSKEGRWDDMGAAIDTELLESMAIVGDPGAVGLELERRYGAFATRVTPTVGAPADPAVWSELIRAASKGAASS